MHMVAAIGLAVEMPWLVPGALDVWTGLENATLISGREGCLGFERVFDN